MRSFRRLRCFAGAAVLALSACGDDNGAGPGGNTRVTVHLTDAVGDVLEAVVTIDEIYLQGGGNGRVVLSNTPETVDLVQLNNTTVVVVDGVEVPAGAYQELRFVISGAYIRVEETAGDAIYATAPDYPGLPPGATVAGNLQTTSLGSSGLKVIFDGAVELSGAETALVVDFDVSQSFGQQAGMSGMWVMHPVITGAQLSEAGSVQATLALGTGVTLPQIGGVGVTLADFSAQLDGETVAFTDTDSDGTFTAAFQHVIPGSYELTVVGPAGLTFVLDPVIPATVDVTAGAQATVAFTLTSATGS